MEKPFPRELAQGLTELQRSEEWKHFVDLSLKMIEDWRKRLSLFSVQDSLEMIAKERIQLQGRIQGLEATFLQMDELIQELKKRNKEQEEEKINAR